MSRKTLMERFEEKYCPEPNTGCWLWTANTRGRYGRMWDGEGYSSAHKISYRLYRGEVPERVCVCHTCDTPTCVNPEHLFLGTVQDNMTDKVKKGRHTFGTKHPKVKLTDDLALAVYREEGFQREVAALYGISQRLVWNIKNKKTWRHIHAA